MIEPGARLANRYRLDEPVSETNGATFWKATDETLARLVAVWTFADGFPNTSAVIHAARATSRIADSRVTQVFDADDTAQPPYLVEEWVIGQSLTDLLSGGPLAPERAAGLIAEAAEALATAHETGLSHQFLTPNKLIWSVGGAVKVTGIGVDAALRGLPPEQTPDVAAVDAYGLGRLLYASLTGHWPESAHAPEHHATKYNLPAAPAADGILPPRQLRAEVPQRLDEIAGYAAAPAPEARGSLTTPRAIAHALSDAPRMAPIPVTQPAAANAPPPERGTSRTSGAFGAAPGRETRGASRGRASSAPDQSRDASRSPVLAKIAIAGAALLVLVGVVTGAWTLGSTMGGDDADPGQNADPQPGDGQSGSGDDPELETIELSDAEGFDPLGDGDEHSDNAGKAIDGDPDSRWKTEGYDGPSFGKLKEGVGLLVDLGDTAEVHEATLSLGEAGAADVQLLVGDDPEFEALQQKAEASGVSGEEDVKLSDPAEGRYVAIWFTSLPQDGEYRGTINEVELRGKT
ncbi:serine/threonine protein kinase [Haloactinospora alba]|uniref:Serine/threonine protein kinase n=2 Tax=Haloactinospora alba TaxID=405555 RepID=A0A543N9S8_9ACTN|nr:serine/threonine protein kinase [Haloactinospora alba]